MGTRYQIHPSVGVPRLGNSRDSFYLAPESIGGLPLECDSNGNAVDVDSCPRHVEQFKDAAGQIRRQAARFKIFAYDDTDPNDAGREVTLDSSEVRAIEWTVHLANKKAAWYTNEELIGDLMLGTKNSYKANKVPWRNAKVVGDKARRKLIIDPGPRSVNQPQQMASFSRDAVPSDYRFASFPDPSLKPHTVNTLGEIMMDRSGRLIVLGGYGNAGGETIIATYTGADTWYDDISDGPVTCRLTLQSGEIVELSAWVLVGSPKFAPELRNVSTLDDVMYDVGARYLNLVPTLFDSQHWPNGWNPDYVANFERDILPIIERPADYIWVANVPSMMSFSAPKFDVRDASESNRANREEYLGYFRDPGTLEISPPHQVLMSPEGVPLMPLNAGTNAVTNQDIDKFMSLSQTQYYLLKQWAAGKFTSDGLAPPPPGVNPLDIASVGNCVGHPMSPGIETSWNTRNPSIYETPYRIKHRHPESYYRAHGLDPTEDECSGGGCEPGDLTKRMSAPWMADFYQCSIEYISFTDPTINVDDKTGIPPAPTYYAYWWPPQAPMYVMSGAMTAEEQRAGGVPAGFQVYFTRGANNIARLVVAWKYMGFIVNQNRGAGGRRYPYFVEVERNHDRFIAGSVAVGQPLDQLAASGSYQVADNYFTPVWFMRDERVDTE